VTVNQVQSYPRGTILFAPGDIAEAVYVLLEGTIVASQGAKQITLGAGGILGDVAFFADRPHSYHAICATNVRTLNITKHHGAQVLSSQPRVALSMLSELAQKVQNKEMAFFQGLQQKEATPAQPGILPEGHPEYHEPLPIEYGEYLFSVDVDCPICQTRFTGTRIRTSRLQLEVQKTDLRTIYRNFEPNYFYIWVCPKCLFAYPERQYTKLSQSGITKGREAWKESPPEQSFAFDVPRTMHQVITSYYLAMLSFEQVGASLEQWANLWLRLVWIYEDLGEKELSLDAAAQAQQYFSEAMSTKSRSSSGDQALYLILGELALRLRDTRGAFTNFRAASTMTGGDPRYKRMAADCIADLRERRES
jgi:uncharacterized protein (DUF2225 family)